MKQRVLRIVAALAVSAVALTSGAALADPIDTVQDALLSVIDVQATGIGPSQIFVAWVDRSKQATHFRIEGALDEAGPYTLFSKVEAATGVCSKPETEVKAQTSNPYLGVRRTCRTSISGLTPSSDPRPYFVRVVPILTPGDVVTVLEGKPSRADTVLLGAAPPTNLRCNGGGSLSCVNVQSVTLTWVDNSDEDAFWVYRGDGVVNPRFGFEPVVRLPANITAYSEFLADFGRKFSYRVVAVRTRTIARIPAVDFPATTDEFSFSNSTGPETVPLETPTTPAPTDPSYLSAVLDMTGGLTLTWIDRAPTGFEYRDEDSFAIEQSPKPAAGLPNFEEDAASQHTRPGLFGEGTVSWTTSLPPDTSRCYRVRAVRNTTTYTAPSFSGFTNTVCPGTKPAAPTNLTATALRNDQVLLRWTDHSDAEDGFLVQRCPGVCVASSAGWIDIATGVPINVTSYLDATTTSLTVYSYRVFAFNTAGRSASSNIATVATPAARLPKPTNLTATASGPRAIDLVWTDTSTDESSFEIEFRAPGGVFSPLASVDANTIYYLDSDLMPYETRCYRVHAFKAPNESSDPSNESCATTTGPVGPKTSGGTDGFPTGVEAIADTDIAARKGNTRVFVRWTDTAINESGFKVEMIAFPDVDCTAPVSPVGRTFTTAATVTAHSGTGLTAVGIEGLQPHSSYLFRVKAVNRDGESAYGPASPPFSGAHPTITQCVTTYGPKRPSFSDPDASGKTKATACDFTVLAPQTAGAVVGLRVYVIAVVPGTSVAHTDTLWVGDAPGSSSDAARNQFIADFTRTGDDWKVNYHFRRGVSYRLLGVSFGAGAPNYASAQADVRDVTVLADCPTDELP